VAGATSEEYIRCHEQRCGAIKAPYFHSRSTAEASRSDEGFLGGEAEGSGQDGKGCNGFCAGKAQAHVRRTKEGLVGEDEGGLGEAEEGEGLAREPGPPVYLNRFPIAAAEVCDALSTDAAFARWPARQLAPQSGQNHAGGRRAYLSISVGWEVP
jgi:hypothetical protein